MAVLAWVTGVMCICYVIILALTCEFCVPRFGQVLQDTEIPATTELCLRAVRYQAHWAVAGAGIIAVVLVGCIGRNRQIAFAVSATVTMIATVLAVGVAVALMGPLMRIMQTIGER